MAPYTVSAGISLSMSFRYAQATVTVRRRTIIGRRYDALQRTRSQPMGRVPLDSRARRPCLLHAANCVLDTAVYTRLRTAFVAHRRVFAAFPLHLRGARAASISALQVS